MWVLRRKTHKWKKCLAAGKKFKGGWGKILKSLGILKGE